jgi:predicted phage terminase large subunit-like protein
MQGNDLYRGRLEYPDLRRKVIALAQQYRPHTIIIENAGPGMNLLQDLMRSMPPPLVRPIGVKPEGDKVQRMAGQTAKIEAGHVHLPKGAAWVDGFLTELLGFPACRHDDQVDSVSQFLRWWQNQYQPPMRFYPAVYFSRPRNFP